MAFKEKFSPEDWTNLQYAIFWVFNAVAGADNKIDKKEKKALESVIANSGKFFNDLAREVQKGFDKLHDDFDKLSTSSQDGLKGVSELLKGKVDDDMGLNYKKTLIAIGVFIGHSSGGWFGSKLSDEEVGAVKSVGEYLHVSVADLERSPNLGQIIQNLNV
ncbi:hypothetical protein ACFLSQ_11845 [Bacteroidota bacterium]